MMNTIKDLKNILHSEFSVSVNDGNTVDQSNINSTSIGVQALNNNNSINLSNKNEESSIV